MAEVSKTQSGSDDTDTNELQSTRAGLGMTDAHGEEGQQTHGRQAAEESQVGGVAKECRDRAEQTWDDTKERVHTFKEDADEYVRDNPTKTVLTALAIGFVLGLTTFRR